MCRISNGSSHDVILLEAGRQPSICVRSVGGRERSKVNLVENALVSDIKQTTTRQAKYAPTPLAHMVEKVLGYMPVYEAGDFGKKELVSWLWHVQNRYLTGLFLSMAMGCT
jgi:hypothetical protein